MKANRRIAEGYLVPTIRMLLETLTAALKEQLVRNDADTRTLINTVASLSAVMARHGPNETVRTAGEALHLRAQKLLRAGYVPRFIVRDMLDEFVRQVESRPRPG